MKKKIKDTINYIYKSDNLLTIKEKCLAFHPADLSILFSKLDISAREKIYNALDSYELALLFSYLNNPIDYFEELDPKTVSNILENMEIDDVSVILNDIYDDELKSIYINNLNEETKKNLNYISKIGEDRVGSIISTNYISVETGIDVKEAMKKLVAQADEFEFIDPIFVTKKGELVGEISLNDLIIARSPKLVDEIMDDHIVSIDINEPLAAATKTIRNYSLDVLPVTDNNRLVGIITSDDAFEIFSDIADTKYGGLAGVSTENLSEKSFLRRLLERLPWLIILLFIGVITSNLMGLFEEVIKQVTILVFFQTLIFDMAGNVGTQSLAVTIQRLVDSNIDKQEIKKHLKKEIRINIINSLFLMVIAFIVCSLFLTIYKTSYSIFLVSLVVSLSMGITIITSSFFGAILPILLSKLKVNPAVGSGPLITTLNDIIAILIYFSLAALLFNLVI